jgi:hypothetical protein
MGSVPPGVTGTQLNVAGVPAPPRSACSSSILLRFQHSHAASATAAIAAPYWVN